MDNPTHKMVNGKLVPLTEQEQQSILNEWQAAEAKRNAAVNRKTWPSKDAFWNEFTEQEQMGIITSEISGIKLLDRQLVMWTGEVWSDDDRVINGLDGLVAIGIITAERKTEITKKQ